MPKGRPRKAGPREPNGRLERVKPDLPPVIAESGLARSTGDFLAVEVVDSGQVVGRTLRARSPLDGLPIGEGRRQVPGEAMRALLEYEAAWSAVAYPTRCTLNREPSGGGGVEAFMDSLAKASARLRWLSSCLPPSLIGVLHGVLKRQVDAIEYLAELRQAGELLVVALTAKKAA